MTSLHVPLLVLLCASATVRAQDKAPQHLLRLSWAEREPTWYCVDQEITARLSLDSTRKTYRIRMQLFWRTETSPADDGATRVVRRLVRVRGAGSEQGDESFAYDSAKDDEEPRQMREFSSLVGLEISSVVDSLGAVRRLELPEALRHLDEGSGVEFLSLSGMIRPLDLELPDLPVAVGESWKGSRFRELADDEGPAYGSEFTLLEVSKGRARIRERFAVTPRDDTPAKKDGDGEPFEPGRRAERVFTLDLRSGRVIAVDEDATMHAQPSSEPLVRMRFTMKRRSRAAGEPVEELEPLVAPAAEEAPVGEAATSRPAGKRDK